MKTPCEILVWYVLPTIRRELARSMIEDHNLTQAQAAKKLDVTNAAISQYRSAKRGNIMIPDKMILREIKNSAKQIINGDDSTMVLEMCRICELVKRSDTLPELYKKHTGKSMPISFCEPKIDFNGGDL